MIINVNKPKDWTSADVVAYIKGRSNFKKVGHAGTLDPLATGVLVVLTNNHTKRQDSIMHSTKEYVGEISFGVSTTTYDLEGELEVSDSGITVKELKNKLPEVLYNFKGEFEQEVPPFSAVKVKGKKLYDLARKSDDPKTLELPRKSVTVEDIEILDVYEKKIEKDGKTYEFSTAKLKITSSSGFYVRSLANDLGKVLGTSALLTGLVRTRVGKYTLDKAKDIKEIEFNPEYYSI